MKKRVVYMYYPFFYVFTISIQNHSLAEWFVPAPCIYCMCASILQNFHAEYIYGGAEACKAWKFCNFSVIFVWYTIMGYYEAITAE